MPLAWLTKSALPSSRADYVINLPTDELWQADFFGAILPLLSVENWEQLDELTPDEMADEWTDILVDQLQNLELAMPVGSIVAFGGSVIPEGWLHCDGSAVSKIEFAALFAVIGGAFGSMSDTHFPLPDIRLEFLRGAGSGSVVGATGGADTHTLTTAQIPAHTHGPASGAQAFFYQPTGGTGGSVGWVAGSSMGTNAVTGSAGGGNSHNNLPSFVSVNFIIKT